MPWGSFKKEVNGQKKLFIANKMVDIPGATHQYNYVNDYEKAGILIILIKQSENKADENVYGINEKGDIVWELNKDNYLNLKHGFRQPYKDDQGDLWIINLGGRHFKIDYKTGKVLDTKYEEIDYTIKENMLHINNKKVKFSKKISKTFPFEDVLIVMIECPSADDKYEHVYGVDKEGNIIWVFNKDNCLKSLAPFNTLNLRVGKWWIGNWVGYEYAVEPKTGEILEREWLK